MRSVNRKQMAGHAHHIAFLLLLVLIGAAVYFVIPFLVGPGCSPAEDTVIIAKSNAGQGYCLWAISPAGKRTAMGKGKSQYCGPDLAEMQRYADQYNDDASSPTGNQSCVEQLRAGAMASAMQFWQKWPQK
jgi:hypothetical protein